MLHSCTSKEDLLELNQELKKLKTTFMSYFSNSRSLQFLSSGALSSSRATHDRIGRSKVYLRPDLDLKPVEEENLILLLQPTVATDSNCNMIKNRKSVTKLGGHNLDTSRHILFITTVSNSVNITATTPPLTHAH